MHRPERVALLDVNVLIALFDAAHIHHEPAHDWFGTNREYRWATCALTELAFVRVVSNAAYPGSRTTLADAVSRLRTFCAEPQHAFWTDSLSVGEDGRFRWQHAQGHRQLTDIYLLALSVSNHGRLATFDSAISLRAFNGANPENLQIITV
jgi:uncharacterized protein